MIIINPLPGQEEENATFLENNHVAVWLKKEDNIEEIITNVLDNSNKLQSMSNCAKSIGKPNSCKTICEVSLKN